LKTKKLQKELKAIRYKELKQYLAVIGHLTEDEKNELREWVADGNSVYENPYMIFDESGCPMDFINGCRIGIDLIYQ